MPKIVNKRFRSAARKSADPLNIVDEKNQQIFTASEQIRLNSLNGNDLFQTIKERLKSTMPSERCIGTDMISTFVTDEQFSNFKPEQINELLKILGILLLDRAENVRYGSVDALCYLSTLSDNICERIVENNVIRSLLLMLQTYFVVINFQEPKIIDRKLTLNLYSDTFNLLAYCSESSSKCIRELAANKNLETIFYKAFSSANLNDNNDSNERKFDFTPIAIAASECLTVLVEDSMIFHQLLIENNKDNDENLSVIIQKIIDFNMNERVLQQDSSIIYLQILSIYVACTAFRQISNISQDIVQNIFTKLINIINLILNFDLSIQLELLLEKMNNEGKSATFGQLQEMQSLKDFVTNIFKSKRCIFELLTNILSYGTSELNDDDYDDDDDDDEMKMIENDYNEEIQMEDVQNFDSNIQCDNHILKLIQDSQICNILKKELNEYLTIPQEKKDIFHSQIYGQEVLQCIKNCTISILSLISNLIQLKQIENLESIRVLILDILLFIPNTHPSEILEESSNVLREILQNNNDFFMLKIEQLHTLEKYLDISQRFQLNFIKICSIIASSLIDKRGEHCPDIVKQVQMIASVLMKLYEKFSSDLVLKAEILDSLIDIFSDDNQVSNAVMHNLNLLNFLRINEKTFKSEVKCQRKLCKNNSVVGTVALNLHRFINYKQKIF